MTASIYGADGVTQIIAGPGISIDVAAGIGVVTVSNSYAAGAGVTAFNSRTGLVSLLAQDVTDALGFVPVSASAISALAPIASPSFTGTPNAPTPGSTDNTTKIATTAFVKTALSGLNGTVTSVALSLPADFTVSGSPVTGAGTLTGGWATTPTGTGAVVKATSPTLTTPVINGFTGDTSTINIGGGQFVKDTSGNVGVGVTPSAWSTGKSIEIASAGNGLFGLGNDNYILSGNYYASGWKYAATGVAPSQIEQSSGVVYFLSAPSGTAGGAVTWTTNAKLDPAAGLLVTAPIGLGYGTGSGGTVTQATSKGTDVTLNKPTGYVTMNNAALTAGASVYFNVSNSTVLSLDTVSLNANSSLGISYRIEIWRVLTGSFGVRVTNITAGSLSEALVFQFNVHKGAAS